METKNAWITLSEKTLFHTPVVELVERETTSSEDGRPHRFYFLKSTDWCNVIPITRDGKIVLVKQFRIGISEPTLEVPGGLIDAEDALPRDAALRELTEETGFVTTASSKVFDLGFCHPNPAMINNKSYFFLVTDVERGRDQHLDTGEMIEVETVALADLPKLILEGKITHALVLSAFLMALLQSRGGEAALLKQLETFRTT